MSDKFYDEFYRQRRNLILISVVLFFVVSSGLSLQKANIWGNEFELKNPGGIITFLWVVWAYWVWRFLVYSLEYQGGFFESLENEAIKVIRRDIDDDQWEMGFVYKSGRLFRTHVVMTYESNSVQYDATDYYKGSKFYKLIFPIIIRTILSHKSFNDQIFPFLVALFPVVYVAFR